MAVDALLTLQTQTTQTATYTGSALTLPTGTPRRGLFARVLYSAAANASGSNTVVFGIAISHDGGNTFYIEDQADPITLSTTAQGGEIPISFEASPTSVANQIQIKLVATFAGAGTSPTITYSAAIELGRP